MGLFASGGPPRLYNNTHHLSSSAPTQQNEAKRQQTPVAKPKPLAEPPAAEAGERPGFVRKLSSYVFGFEAEGEIGQEPATEESVAIEMEPTTMREQEELEPEC